MDYVGIAEEIDRQMLVNLTGRIGVTGMYAAAREKLGMPLTLHAAQHFEGTLDEEALRLLVNPNMPIADVGKRSEVS